MSWRETMEAIGPDDRLEIAKYQDFVDDQETFEAGGITKAVWDQLFPFLEQQAWSMYQLFVLVNTLDGDTPSILEIGSGRGGSMIGMKLAKPGATFMTIDPFAPYDETSAHGTVKDYPGFKHAAFLENIKDFDINPEVVQLKSSDAFETLRDRSFDLIYIDGNHSYDPAKLDMMDYQHLLKPDGVFCGHDYHPRFPGVIDAAKEVFGVDGFEVKENSSIWVKK